MKPFKFLFGIAFFAGCAAAPLPVERVAFRAGSAPIYSAAAFMPSRIEGGWRQVASYAQGQNSCAAGGVELQRRPSGLHMQGELCLNGRRQRISSPVQISGPGRLAVEGMSDWWVIWVDYDYRTMAVGTPDGSFGFILDRGKISHDRLVAAAEIFDFNGYSKALLRRY